MKIVLDTKDYDEARAAMEGCVDFVPTDREIDHALARDPNILPLVVAWTWGDTEVREKLAPALEQVHAEVGE